MQENLNKKFKIFDFNPLIKLSRKFQETVLMEGWTGTKDHQYRYYKFQKSSGGNMINNMVLSTEIEWIGYEHKRNMLQVEFIAGPVYQYDNVPERVYEDFLTAPSHGRFFESAIKGKFSCRKIR